MKKRKYLIPSLLAAGFQPATTDAALPSVSGTQGHTSESIFSKRFELEHKYDLAGHRSHSSHRSHGSHRSSSTGGYSVPRSTAPKRQAPSRPAPLIQPESESTPPSSVLPSLRDSAPKTLPGNTPKFRQIAMQVQIALQAFGYYNGPIDGIIGSGSKVALSSFQRDHGLKVTGTITLEVLNVFGIQAK